MGDTQLRELWNFDDADLSANHMGQLTEKQRKLLISEHKSQRGIFIGIGAVVAILFCCLPVLLIGSRALLPTLLSGDLANVQEAIPLFAMGGFAIVFLGIAVLTVGATVGIYLLRANKKADISLKHVEGKVAYTWGTKRVRTPGSSVRSYEDVRVLYLNLGDKKFEVKEKLQEMIKEGEEWAIHYTSYPFKFLSAEQNSKGG